jgi:hypothetical protein
MKSFIAILASMVFATSASATVVGSIFMANATQPSQHSTKPAEKKPEVKKVPKKSGDKPAEKKAEKK